MQNKNTMGSRGAGDSDALEELARCLCLCALLRPSGVLLMCFPVGRHGQRDFVAALEAASYSAREERLEAALMQGCSNQGTQAEVAAHPFVLLRAQRSAAARDDADVAAQPAADQE